MMSENLGISCPVCDVIMKDSELMEHVNQHFHAQPGPSSVHCSYPGCDAVIIKEELSDHLLAHNLHDESTSNTENLNDSTLARFIQEEESNNFVTSKVDDEDKDMLLAQQIYFEEQKNKESEHFKELQEKYGMVENGGYKKQFEEHMSKQVGKRVSVSDYYDQKANMISASVTGNDSGETRTSGLIEAIDKKSLETSTTIFLCSPSDHFSAGVSDRGWGCGYRNLQMLLSSLFLQEKYRTLIMDVMNIADLPSVPRLQLLIEKAWENGYDQAGKEQLGGKLRNTRKWIGATEVATLLRFCKIRARIVDFHKPTSSDGSHPQLFEWIEKYYKERESPFPLYIQHQGHSRTCVGFQVTDSMNLLLFDPSLKVETVRNLLADLTSYRRKKTSSHQLKTLLKSANQMKSKQFQIVYVDGIYENLSDIMESKVIRSTRIP